MKTVIRYDDARSSQSRDKRIELTLECICRLDACNFQMDCSGAGAGENNGVALSFFFPTDLVQEGSGKVHPAVSSNGLLPSVLYSGKALVDGTP